MALAKRPSDNLKNKQNINPSINRDTEVVAEDIKEIADIQEDHAILIDSLTRAYDGKIFYGFRGSLALFQAEFPTVLEGYGIIDEANGNPQIIATVANGVWTATTNAAPIQLYATKTARPQPGVGNVIYIVKDEKILSFWYDGSYKDFGRDGYNGKSTYQIALDFGFIGSEEQWLVSLKGADGASAYQIWLDAGNAGTEQDFINFLKGAPGAPGADGDSAYQIWLDAGNAGTEQDFIDFLKGAPGAPGADGDSAYQIWLDAGNAGTEQDFIDFIKGDPGAPGADGDSAYQIWLDAGNVGTEQDFIDFLKGDPGADGQIQSVSGTAVDSTDPANPIINLPESVGSSNEQINIVPTGTINGTNKLFTVPTAYVSGKIKVFRNGVRQTPIDDYTEVSTTSIEFTTAPLVDGEGAEKLLIDYTPQ